MFPPVSFPGSPATALGAEEVVQQSLDLCSWVVLSGLARQRFCATGDEWQVHMRATIHVSPSKLLDEVTNNRQDLTERGSSQRRAQPDPRQGLLTRCDFPD